MLKKERDSFLKENKVGDDPMAEQFEQLITSGFYCRAVTYDIDASTYFYGFGFPKELGLNIEPSEIMPYRMDDLKRVLTWNGFQGLTEGRTFYHFKFRGFGHGPHGFGN